MALFPPIYFYCQVYLDWIWPVRTWGCAQNDVAECYKMADIRVKPLWIKSKAARDANVIAVSEGALKAARVRRAEKSLCLFINWIAKPRIMLTKD